jgi:SAM-dependent methyltransferase
MVTDEAPVAATACAFCGSGAQALVRHYTERPAAETDFGIKPYSRTLWRCEGCGHVVNRHGFDLDRALYQGNYAEATYGDRMRATFERIMDLPPERSDNRQRVARLDAFARDRGWLVKSCLDVGSGLGVFPAALREAGWWCVALDPDPRATAMIAERARVNVLTGDFMNLAANEAVRLLSFNKVLEHVTDPVAMLRRAASWMAPDGVIYVELPDGEAALLDPDEGPDREEFFVEHYDAYSPASLAMLARLAGFETIEIERLREPSGKYTLRAFLAPTAAPA